jgi:hypothetical protein
MQRHSDLENLPDRALDQPGVNRGS